MVQWKVFIDPESIKDSRDKDIEAKLKPELQNIIGDTFAYFERMADVKIDWEEHFTVGSSESEVLFEDCVKQVEKFGVMPGEMEPTRFVKNVNLIRGISAEPKPHNALTGARYEFESLCRIIYGKTVLPQFKDKPVPEELAR